jgi:hypothetical protein
MKTEYSIECDGSLVVGRRIVLSPSEDCTREQIAELVRRATSAPAMLDALKVIAAAACCRGQNDYLSKSQMATVARLAVALAEGVR